LAAHPFELSPGLEKLVKALMGRGTDVYLVSGGERGREGGSWCRRVGILLKKGKKERERKRARDCEKGEKNG